MKEEKIETMKELYSSPVKKRKIKWGWIVISFSLFSTYSSMSKSLNENRSITVLLSLLSVFVAPFFYYWLKRKLKIIKNEFIKSILFGIFTIVLFIIMSSVLGVIGDILILKYAK